MNWKRLLFIIFSISSIWHFACSQMPIKTVPPVENGEIHLQSAPEKIVLSTSFSTRGKKIHWNIEGPGALKGNITSAEVVYIPPENIYKEVDDVKIILTVKDPKGKESFHPVWFTLKSSSPLSPNPYSEEDDGLKEEFKDFRRLEQNFKNLKDQGIKNPDGMESLRLLEDECYQNYISCLYQKDHSGLVGRYNKLYLNVQSFLLSTLKGKLKNCLTEYDTLPPAKRVRTESEGLIDRILVLLNEMLVVYQRSLSDSGDGIPAAIQDIEKQINSFTTIKSKLKTDSDIQN